MTVNNSEGNADNTMTRIDWNELLDPLPLPMETGYRRLDDGTLHIAARTDMHDCKTAMFEWWFRWRCDTQKYIWWHPIDHVSSHWAGDLSPDTHVGSEHIVVERFADAPAAELVIQFHGADDVFDAERYRTAVDRGDVSGSVLGRVGTGHHPPRDTSGKILGGRLLHVGRDTPWGFALRSHFHLGTDLPAMGLTPSEVAAEVPDELGRNLLLHAYNEFTFLSRILGGLCVAENRDKIPPVAPW
ncbi:DAPG hydrolase family protein [Mycolicibacterium smegmatis]|uniref:DAPG hydrolase family protein n=1 Tax=Mycolicibacterium smegmatis TaxID=1772 RepID=UPI001EFC0D74|nr:hypothetical protein [Mycolicibacterium smegmatis]MCP2622491.1 hypothetical protein [Mycolicibacterium smegmatis]